MRKVIVAGFVLFAFAGHASHAFAQNAWANKAFNGNPNQPITVDFGIVAKGAQLEKVLPITNIWKVPLTISPANISCGCTTAKESVNVLQPNQSGELVIKMDTTRFTGPKTVYVYLTLSGGPQFQSTANIVVTANARQDVVLNPGELDFGSIAKGQRIERSLEVEYAGKNAWKVEQVVKNVNSPFDLKIENLQPKKVAGGANLIGYKLIATLKADAPIGTFRETVDLKTNDAQQPVVSFLVVGNVTPVILVAPNPIQAVGLKVGVPSQTYKIVVSGNKDRPFRILGIQGAGQGAGGDISITIPERPPTYQHIIDLQVTPNAPGLLNRQIILQTDMGNESVKLSVQGNVNP